MFHFRRAHSSPIALIALPLAICVFAEPAMSQPEPDPASAEVPADPIAVIPPPSPALQQRITTMIERLRQPIAVDERDGIIEQLIDIGEPAMPALVEEMKRRSRRTWPLTVYALGAMGDERVIPALRREASRESSRSRMDVLYALALAGDGDALVEAIRSPHGAMMFDQGTTAVDYIAGAIGRDAVPILIREIPRRSQRSRVAALSALGTLADDSAVDFLIEWSRREDATDRRYALMALSRIGDSRAIPRVLEATTSDRDRSVREAALEGLGYLRADEGVDVLVTQLENLQPSPEKSYAAWSLGLIGGERAITALVQFTISEPPERRSAAVSALGNTGHADAIPHLRQAGLSADGELARIAAEALTRNEERDASSALLDICGEAQVRAAKMTAALELVARADPRGTPCALNLLREDIETRGGLSREATAILDQLPMSAMPTAADSLEKLAEVTPKPAVRYRLESTAKGIRTVDDLGDDVAAWIDVLTNGSNEEVDLAIRRLGAMGDPAAVSQLERAFGRLERDRNYLIPRALGQIGSDRATPFLVALISDDLYRVDSTRRAREEAAIALARYATAPHVAEALKNAFIDEPDRMFVALMAYARVAGPGAIPELQQIKSLLLRRRGPGQVIRHEWANWSVRLLRRGREIPIGEVIDPAVSDRAGALR